MIDFIFWAGIFGCLFGDVAGWPNFSGVAFLASSLVVIFCAVRDLKGIPWYVGCLLIIIAVRALEKDHPGVAVPLIFAGGALRELPYFKRFSTSEG